MTPWTPTLRGGNSPLYVRIADAIERDIKAGALPAGSRLPPHRDLAHRLSIGIGTVTKAYSEAEQRGLLTGQVGRGSYVAEIGRRQGARAMADEPLDLARNLPPITSGDRHLAETLAKFRRRSDLAAILGYGPPEGNETVRAAGARWLTERHGLSRVSAEELLPCNGGQHALLLVLGAICRPGDAVLCEASTFFGLKTLADFLGYQLVGVEMDGDGIVPDALERAASSSGARVLYTVPTLHNPTTTTTGERRRRELASVAERLDLLIVEDDAYRVLVDRRDAPTAYADLAPRRTAYVATLSKGMLPGLRLGFVKLPDQAMRNGVIRSIRATNYSLPSLGGLIFAEWVEEGIAQRISNEVVAEAAARTELARSILGSALGPVGGAQSLHVWMPLSPLDAERTAARALRAGVDLTPPDALTIGASAPSGLRICLGGAPDLESLATGLSLISKAMDSEVAGQARALL